MATIFTRIMNGEIPGYVVAENNEFFAFLDIQPLAKGHTLVVPRMEVDYIFDLNSELHKGLWDFARVVATGLRQAVPCKRIGVAVIGLEVPHTHIHLIPMNQVSDMNFARPKMSFSKEEMEQTAQTIRSKIIL